jgi:AraC-like DNA-binding protein
MECRAAVLQGFYAGRRSVSFHDKNKVFSSIARIPIMRTAAVNILSAMDRYNNARCGEIVAEVCDRLKEMEIHPAAARLQMIALVGRVTDYYIEAGLDADEIEALAVNSMTNLLSCGFIGDAREIVEAFCDSIQKLNKSSHQSVDARFRQYVDDCIEKYSADCSFSLSFAAELSNYSPSYFSRLFARVYGMPFSRYLADYRVERAVRLLTQESLSLQDIALKTGFRSTSYFCSVFKGRMGISPRQYQNRRSRKIGEKPLKAGDAGGGAAYGAEDVEGMEGLAGMEGMEGMEGVADTEDASVAPGGAAESEAESEAEAPAGADGAGPIEGEPALLTK